MIVIAAVIVVTRRARTWGKVLLVVVGGFMLLLLARHLLSADGNWLMVAGPLGARFREALESGGAGRTDIWAVGWHALGKYWAFGAGLDNFPLVYNEFSETAARWLGYDRGAHNIYLGVFVELGLAGLILLIAAIVVHFRRLKQALESSRPGALALHGAFWGMLLMGATADIVWRKYFWLLWGSVLLVSSSPLARLQADPHGYGDIVSSPNIAGNPPTE